jgi:hypothetical protein
MKSSQSTLPAQLVSVSSIAPVRTVNPVLPELGRASAQNLRIALDVDPNSTRLHNWYDGQDTPYREGMSVNSDQQLPSEEVISCRESAASKHKR